MPEVRDTIHPAERDECRWFAREGAVIEWGCEDRSGPSPRWGPKEDCRT